MAYEKERAALKKLNNSRKWALKLGKMADKQVLAIYERLKLQQKV
jgi:hypothetical protein